MKLHALKCRICESNNTWKTEAELYAHFITLHPELTCDRCKPLVNCKNINEYKRHMEKVHPDI